MIILATLGQLPQKYPLLWKLIDQMTIKIFFQMPSLKCSSMTRNIWQRFNFSDIQNSAPAKHTKVSWKHLANETKLHNAANQTAKSAACKRPPPSTHIGRKNHKECLKTNAPKKFSSLQKKRILTSANKFSQQHTGHPHDSPTFAAEIPVYVKLTSFIQLKFIIFKIQFFRRDGKHHAGTRQFETKFRFLCHFISHETCHYQLWGWDAWERFSFLWYQHHMFDIKFNVETLKCEFASLVFYPAAVDTFEIFCQKINETDINIRLRTHGNQMHLIAISSNALVWKHHMFTSFAGFEFFFFPKANTRNSIGMAFRKILIAFARYARWRNSENYDKLRNL